MGALQGIEIAQLLANIGSFGLIAWLAVHLVKNGLPAILADRRDAHAMFAAELSAERKAREELAAKERAAREELASRFSDELREQRHVFREELEAERRMFERKITSVLLAVKGAGPDAIERVATALNGGHNGEATG